MKNPFAERSSTSCLFLLLAMLVTVCSCEHRGDFDIENYTRAVKSGFTKIPAALEIEALYGEADHFISYSGPNVDKKWRTEVFFDGRYILTMEIVVKTNQSFNEVIEVVGEPSFFLSEASEIIVPKERGVETTFSGDWKFGLEEWRTLFKAKGDFSAIGIILKKNQPVNNFESYVESKKRLRVRVRPD